MKFWDTSALMPLLTEEEGSAEREMMLKEDPDVLVWYGTLAEVESALCRKERENPELADEIEIARGKLRQLSAAWIEVEPTEAVRARALRLLRVHPLRAADAFQLAAALVANRERTEGRYFLTADLRLQVAARAEGFWVV